MSTQKLGCPKSSVSKLSVAHSSVACDCPVETVESVHARLSTCDVEDIDIRAKKLCKFVDRIKTMSRKRSRKSKLAEQNFLESLTGYSLSEPEEESKEVVLQSAKFVRNLAQLLSERETPEGVPLVHVHPDEMDDDTFHSLVNDELIGAPSGVPVFSVPSPIVPPDESITFDTRSESDEPDIPGTYHSAAGSTTGAGPDLVSKLTGFLGNCEKTAANAARLTDFYDNIPKWKIEKLIHDAAKTADTTASISDSFNTATSIFRNLFEKLDVATVLKFLSPVVLVVSDRKSVV